MNGLQAVEKRAEIIKLQNEIILAQAEALEQLGAVVMEEERAEAHEAYKSLLWLET